MAPKADPGAEPANDFPVDWEDPADAAFCWQYDPIHSPDPVTPLGFDLFVRPFVTGFGWGGEPIQVNYYVFYSFSPPQGEDAATSAPPRPAGPARIAQAGKRWAEEILPEVLGYIDYYRDTDFDALPDAELAAAVERLHEVRLRSGRLHTLVLAPHHEAMKLLMERYKELTGGDDLGAFRLVQGYTNKSVEAGVRLWQVSRRAASIPSVRKALEDGNAPAAERLASLEREPAAAPFVEAFRAYLDEFGWRSDLELAALTWAEDPTVPLDMLRSYLETEGYDPIAEQQRLVEDRKEALRRAMDGLDEKGRRRLGEAVEVAGQVAHLSEDHNYYIDQRLKMLPRRLLLAAGRLLVTKGALAGETGVFYLRRGELGAALEGDGRHLGSIAEARSEEMARWARVTPPPYIGAAPAWGAPPAREGSAGERRDVLRGVGVSGGVARGPARVLGGLDEAGRLRPGDVLVARATLPPWTPLFAVASAVVTETGGMLSHTAVVAREYGLPAVLGVPDAMRHLRDGQLIEVDGGAGAVRVVG